MDAISTGFANIGSILQLGKPSFAASFSTNSEVSVGTFSYGFVMITFGDRNQTLLGSVEPGFAIPIYPNIGSIVIGIKGSGYGSYGAHSYYRCEALGTVSVAATKVTFNQNSNCDFRGIVAVFV